MPITRTYYKVHRVFPDPDYLYLENTYAGDNTLTITKTGTPTSTDLSYSLDKNTWTDIYNGGTVTVPQGGKVYLRSTTGMAAGASNNYTISMSQTHTVGGHIASLIDYSNISSINTIPSYAFYGLFKNDTNLTNTTVDFSGITTIQQRGCSSMFYGCTNMTGDADLSDVISIETNGCTEMYYQTKITSCDLTNLTTLGDGALGSNIRYFNYGAFAECSHLTTIIGFNKLTTVGDSGLGRAFYNCTSLITGADLSNVTVTTGDTNFAQMYLNCQSLNLAVSPNLNTWNTSLFNNWLSGVAATGVVRKPAGLTITADSASGVPTGWTTEDY